MQTIGGDKIELSQDKLTQLRKERADALNTAVVTGKSWPVAAWLNYLDNLNPEAMELGLERVRVVATRMGLFHQLTAQAPTIVSVAGTNGKGSTSALIAHALGKFMKVGLFTSPHLLQFNERIEIAGKPISDEALCAALYAVVCAQQPTNEDLSKYQGQMVPLTYFEIVTLAAMAAFLTAGCRLIVLEVGLGGRLDSTNIFDAQVAVITSIGLDHMKILGNTTTAIAYEKAGIIKPHSTVILGANIDEAAKTVILKKAGEEGATVLCENHDFAVSTDDKTMLFTLGQQSLSFSLPAVPFGCAGPALAAMTQLLGRMTVQALVAEKLTHPVAVSMGFAYLAAAHDLIDEAIAHTKLLGRMTAAVQVPNLYLDVAHNVPAAEHLVEHELPHKVHGEAWVVMGMLKDKDVEGVLKVVQPHFKRFFLGSLHTQRGESSARLAAALRASGVTSEQIYAADTVEEALRQALAARGTSMVPIVVLGSFVTVAEAWHYLCQLS